MIKMWGNCELKQLLVWASSCNTNSWINQLFPNKNHIHLSFQLHNKIVYTFCNLILQPLKLQELGDNSMVWKNSYYMPNNKEPVGLKFNSEDKKQNISKTRREI